MRMRNEPAAGQDMDRAPVSFSAQRQHLIDHREAGTKDTDTIPALHPGQPSRLPAVVHHALHALFTFCDSLHRQTCSTNAETQNDIAYLQRLAVFQGEGKAAL
ncbi:hypothetical protein C241_14025 [Bradyrhizobium lupini HPC(L)]|uniref:Uncharacterized protein n=1 Tax=Bradyrhizobium lupini HPC(L) TaxID=1229491 RepID=A0ABN0HL26_RHILU|nr:hypothetical protein C241_14025 [Bradyrhizobium lupini HPC(L)]